MSTPSPSDAALTIVGEGNVLPASDAFTATVPELGPVPGQAPVTRSAAATVTRNSVLSVGRLLATTLIALILPAYLAHHLPVKVYGAWILILQMSAFVGYLDFGVQAGVAKFVAEYRERGDSEGAARRVSAGMAIMVVAAILGVLLTLILAWQVPVIFREMPAALYGDVRISLILVGISLSVFLLCSVPSAIFLGLQRYGVPTTLALVDRVLYTAVVLAAVRLHWSLAAMGAAVAGAHLAVGALQVIAWKKLASEVQISLRGLDRAVMRQMLGYCSVLALWTLGMLCVTGMDVTIVGHFDFSQTAFYSIATMPTNFLVAILGAAIGPLLPAASALSTRVDPAAMGQMLQRLTRYAVLLLGLSGLPLLVGGYWILKLWVGPGYAGTAVGYLRVLVIANMIRNIGLPYATMLVATGRQRVAIAGAIAEAVVNLTASLLLARHMGAMGVAVGTLLGSVVSIGMHFAVGMHYTRTNFAVGRWPLLLRGVCRPALMAVPSLICARLWWSAAAPQFGLVGWSVWAVSTLLVGWFLCVDSGERDTLLKFGMSRLRFNTV